MLHTQLVQYILPMRGNDLMQAHDMPEHAQPFVMHNAYKRATRVAR